MGFRPDLPSAMTIEEVRELHKTRGKIITLLSAEHGIWILCDVNGKWDEATLTDEEKIKLDLLRKHYDGSERFLDTSEPVPSDDRAQCPIEVTYRKLEKEL